MVGAVIINLLAVKGDGIICVCRSGAGHVRGRGVLEDQEGFSAE